VAVAKWSAAGTIGANIAGTTLDGLAASATSAFITYDNSTNRDLYAVVQFDLGSITTVAGASITLRQFVVPTGGVAPDNTGSVGGGYEASEMLTVGASAKVGNFRIRLAGPYSLRFCVTNNTTVAFAGSGNSLKFITTTKTCRECRAGSALTTRRGCRDGCGPDA
jgi:hypothetical protein